MLLIIHIYRCTYDFLEIIDSHATDYNREFNGTAQSYNNENTSTRHHQTKVDSDGGNENDTFTPKNIDIFENFLSIYRTHRMYLIQTPDTISTYYERQQNDAVANTPRRICGDWNSKVKLLRYRSSGPIMGLHFLSDYSHHFGGYKAKVVIKNGKRLIHSIEAWNYIFPSNNWTPCNTISFIAASKCSDDRLKPYNGSCYLFVSYPEVDWWTAQQVCAGIHGELATVTAAEEQRFIVTNLRNELDYSPQTIYWLGGKLEANKYLKWIDGSNITYKVSFLQMR